MARARGREGGPCLRARFSSASHPNGDLLALLRRHPLNHALEVLLPNCSLDAATALQRRGAPFFYTASLSLPQLCDPTFVEAQLGDAAGDATGRVYAVTAASPLDGERDAAALLPNGELHLSLAPQRFKSLGVCGAAAPSARGTAAQPPERYHSVRRLCARTRRRGGDNRGGGEGEVGGGGDGGEGGGSARGCKRRRCARADACFAESAHEPLRFLFAKSAPLPGGGGGGSAEIAFPPSACAVRHLLRPASRSLAGLRLPPLDALFPAHDAAASEAAARDLRLLRALHEWVGAVAAGLVSAPPLPTGGGGDDVDGDDAPYQWGDSDGDSDGDGDGGGGGSGDNDGGCGGDRLSPRRVGAFPPCNGRAHATRWTGLVTPEQVASACGSARSAVDACAAPWAALTVWGFADSPIAWTPPPPRIASVGGGGKAGGGARAAGRRGGGGGSCRAPRPRRAGEEHFVLFVLPKGRWLLLEAAEVGDAFGP